MRLTEASLTSKIRSAIKAFRAAGSPEVGRGSVVASAYERLGQMFRISHERNQIHRDLNRMDKDDEIVQFALTTIANRATGMEDPTLDAFQVALEPDTAYEFPASEPAIEEARREIADLVQRLNLRTEVWQIARRTPKYGNEFREVLVDAKTGDIIGLKLLPEHTIWPAINNRGDRIPGYEQRLENNAGEAIKFTEWEIIHFTFGELDGYLGTPLLGCARKNWKRLNMAEDVTAIGRLVRAFAKWVHRVPVNANDSVQQKRESIESYKNAMTKLDVFNTESSSIEKWEVPEDVKTNFFIPDDGSGKGGVDMHDPTNAQLQNLADIEHFLNRLITATTIPKRYFPFEGSTPKLSEGGGSAEDKHFACTLMFVQMILKKGMAELFDRQLILKGIDPRSVRYVIRMADISTTDQMRNAQTQVALSKVAETWLKQYPELRDSLPVFLREFTKISDASLAELSTVEVKPLPKPVTPAATPPADDRTQLPGGDAGPDGRMKV
jgi:hypothetical protein